MTIGHVGADESRKGGVSLLGVILRVCKVFMHVTRKCKQLDSSL